MKYKEFIDELEFLIRARYSIIYIYTTEEERAINILAGLSKNLGKRLITWTCTKGLTLDGKALDPQSTDFKIALTLAEELASEPTMFLWLDVHPLLKQAAPSYIRKFREFSQIIRSGVPSNSIIVSPSLEIPIELQKEITIIDLPLPDLQEVRDIVTDFINVYKGRAGVNVDTSVVTVEALSRAAIGLSKAEIENVLAKSLVKYRRISEQEVGLILEEKKQVIRKSGILEYVSSEYTDLSQIGGLQNLKRWLEKRKLAFTQNAKDFGIEWPKGVLLVGVPGCGKSLCAKCVAATWQMPLLRLDLGRVFSGIVGSSEANMRMALSMCETVSPAIIWIDEIEKALSGIDSGASDGGTATRVFGTLLTWMQEKRSPVFIFATANKIDRLPPELLRKGRFDEIFFVDLPSHEERQEIFKIHLGRLKRDIEKFDFDKLAHISGEDFWGNGIRLAGSEIEAAIKEGLLEAFSRRSACDDAKADLTTDDLEKAIKRSVPLAKTRKNDIEFMRDWAKENAVRASAYTGKEDDEIKEIIVGRNIDF